MILKQDNEQKRNAVLNTDKKSGDDEVMMLVKENSPRLLAKSKLIYPDFFEKIYRINPELQNSELTFCVFLKLNLSTKEIAKYTYVTPKAIQNRKNRIRKKLNIASSLDIYNWINTL